jgi:hypothetical protein
MYHVIPFFVACNICDTSDTPLTLFVIPMITANASTMEDDLGVVASGNVAIVGAPENNAPSCAAPHVISPTGVPMASSCMTKVVAQRRGVFFHKSGSTVEGSVFSHGRYGKVRYEGGLRSLSNTHTQTHLGHKMSFLQVENMWIFGAKNGQTAHRIADLQHP